MTSTPEIRRVLRVTFEGDSMRGSLDDASGPRPFSGWLELLSAIEDLRADALDPAPTDGAQRNGGAMPLTANHAETVVVARPAGIAVKTQLKAGLGGLNHNETVVAPRRAGVAVRTELKAGLGGLNHNETVVVARPAGVAVRTQLMAGLGSANHNETLVVGRV